MAGRDMDEARALLRRHVVGGQQPVLIGISKRAQRVTADRSGRLRDVCHAGPGTDPGLRAHFLGQGIRQRQLLPHHGEGAFLHRVDLIDAVGDLLTIGQRPVAGDGPGGCGPDQDRCPFQRRVLRPDDREPDPDGEGRMVVILDLRLGEAGLLHHRPHDGLRPLVERSVHQKLQQFADSHRLGFVGHGQIGTFPVAEDAEALEPVALHIDPVIGEVAAFLAEFLQRHLVLVLAGLAVFLLDLPFDRQAVAVPARHVVGVEAQHLAGTVDHVLQDLVQRVSGVDVPVRIGRSVMQDELLPPLRAFAQLSPDIHVVPPLQDLRFLLRQAGAHGKVGLRQEDGVLVVLGHV